MGGVSCGVGSTFPTADFGDYRRPACRSRQELPITGTRLADFVKGDWILLSNLDALDLRILTELQKDGRLSNNDLAERVGLSPSPCLRRMKRLQRDGIVTRYVALVEPASVGLTITAFVRVSLDRQDATQLELFEKAVARWPQVLECYLMTGESDYQLRVIAADLADYETFLREKLARAPGVAKIQSSLAFRPIIYRTELPLS